MFISISQQLEGIDGRLISVRSDNESLSFENVFEYWVKQEAFRDFFIDMLRQLPFSAIRWETPALIKSSAGRPFECVVINSPGLESKADLQTFRSLFEQMSPGTVGVFPNLGGDALMVLPSPLGEDSAYSHLLAFLRTTPREQLHDFWRTIGESAIERLGDKPLWLNTAGGGVAWLHVRLDDRPKYYVYGPYREVTT
jgi:hypothetical protein